MVRKFRWMAITAARLSAQNATLRFRASNSSHSVDGFDETKGRRVPEVLPKAPDGFEPPQKAVPAFPIPLGYGAISKYKETGKTTNNEATDCPNSEMTGLMMRFDCVLRGVHNLCAPRLHPSLEL
jgi:hypothetical protein